MVSNELEEKLKNKEWRVEHLYFIINKKEKKVVFKRNTAQRKFQHEKHIRNILLKIRQLGFTTDACIDGLDDVLFNENFTFVMMSQDRESQEKIFRRIKYAWDNIDQDIKEYMGWVVCLDRSNELSFGHNSSISVALTTRSGTVNRLHISEMGKICAKYPDKAKEIISGAIPSVVPNGRIDIESTAEGDIGEYHDMFFENWGKEPKNNLDFKSHFFSFIDDDEYELEGEFDLPQDIIDMGNRFNLKKEKLNWYYFTRKTLGKLIKQEYPCTVDEAFLSSGDKFFDMDIMPYQILFIKQGRNAGSWTYYEDYRPNHTYSLGADVSLGVGRDSSTCVIYDHTDNKVVATYRDNKISPDMFAYEIRNGAEKYGNCLVAPERNSIGEGTISILKGIYNNIYAKIKTDKFVDDRTEVLGWHTNLATKPKMLSELKTALDESIIKVVSNDLLNEIRSYTFNDISIIIQDEDQTTHWDLLIALAIAFQMKTEVCYSGPVKTYIPVKPEGKLF